MEPAHLQAMESGRPAMTGTRSGQGQRQTDAPGKIREGEDALPPPGFEPAVDFVHPVVTPERLAIDQEER